MNSFLWNFSSLDLIEYVHPKKLLTLHLNCHQLLTPIETGQKKLEYFIPSLHPLRIRTSHDKEAFRKISLNERYPKNTIWDILKKTMT